MHRSLLFRVIALVAIFFVTSCASTYQSRAKPAREAFNSGDYDKAVEIIEKIKPAPRDKLLHLLDKGMILHGAGKYKESNQTLTEAEDLWKNLSIKSVSKETGATLWSEEGVDYAGDKYERVMIPTIRMLNYVALGDWDGALIEVRRIRYTVEKVYGSTRDFDNAFALYFSAVVWETLGHINDALIDYKQLGKHGKQVPYYAHDIKTTSSRLGLADKLPEKGNMAWDASKKYRDDRAQILVVIESGEAPYYVAESVTTGYFTISVPTVRSKPIPVQSVMVKIDGKEVGQTYPFYNIAEDILGALKERQKRTFVRKMIKLSTQTGLYVAGNELMKKDDTKSELAGLALTALSFSMSVAEKADERSWRTLPGMFQLGRFYVSQGTHEIELIPQGGGKTFTTTLDVKPGKPEMVLVRYPKSTGIAEKLKLPEPTRIAEARGREKVLKEKLKENPSDGNIKIELAFAKMERGSYEVNDLLVEGLKDGGNKNKGAMGLVISHAVGENIKGAIDWAEKENFTFYENALKYTLKKEKKVPTTNLSNKESLTNGFDYYLYGLMREKEKKYEEATKMFAKAHQIGLYGELVANKVMDNYKKTSKEFKKSKEGTEIASNFADVYLSQMN
ncbi:hypothetical protein KKA47_00785 [bacterium]|nr:hypothetical protein [bacterium]